MAAKISNPIFSLILGIVRVCLYSKNKFHAQRKCFLLRRIYVQHPIVQTALKLNRHTEPLPHRTDVLYLTQYIFNLNVSF